MKQILILACLFTGPFLLCCETRVTPKPVGGGCEYRDIPGTCRVEAITPSGPNTYGEGFRTLFSFVPDSETEPSGSGTRMTIGDGQDPTKGYLKENRIEVGSRFRCIRKLETKGACSPEVFVFPGFKKITGRGSGVRGQGSGPAPASAPAPDRH
jgi:hypothetical protein